MAGPTYQGVRRRSPREMRALYVRSRLGALRDRGRHEALERFALFVGYARSGHTVLASILDAHPYLGAVAHDVLVDGVVDDLLEQDVNAVVVVLAVTDSTDVHPRTLADVFQRAEGLDLGLVVIVLGQFAQETTSYALRGFFG